MHPQPPSEGLGPEAIPEDRSSVAGRLDEGTPARGPLRCNETRSGAGIGLPLDLLHLDPGMCSNEVTEEVAGWDCRCRLSGPLDH